MNALGPSVISAAFNPTLVQDLVDQFGEDGGGFSRFDLEQFALAPAPRFYSAEQIDPIATWLKATVVNGGRVVLRGTKTGVGTSSFAADFARAFNYSCERDGYADRIIYLSLNGLNTSKHLIEALAEEVGLEIRPGPLQRKSFRTLAKQFLSSAVRRRATTLVLDHLELASDAVKEGVLDLMLLSDPALRVALNMDEYEQWCPRMGFILVTNRRLKDLFKGQRRIFHALSFGEIQLKPFEDVNALAEALRGAGEGFESLDVESAEDRLLLTWILSVTDGRIAFIAPLVRLMELVAMLKCDAVATLETAQMALKAQRGQREEYFGWTEPELKARKGFWTTPVPDEEDTDGVEPISRVRVSTDRKTRIKEKKKAEKRIREEQSKVLRRSRRSPQGM